MRRPIVPVAVKRDVPREVTPELEVVPHIGHEPDPTRIGERWQQSAGDIKVRFVETKEAHLCGYQSCCNLLCGLAGRRLLIMRVLPGNSTQK